MLVPENGFSMADESTRRSYQSNGPYTHGGQAPGASRRPSDPLAELARLIGQSDPYTEIGQNTDRGRNGPRNAEPQQPEAESMDWRKAVAAMPPFENLQPEPDELPGAPHHVSHHDDFERGRDPYYPATTGAAHSGRPADDNSYDRPFPAEPQYPQSGHYQSGRDIGHYAAGDHESGQRPDDRYDTMLRDTVHRDGGQFDAGRYDRGRLDVGRYDASRPDGDMRQQPSAPFYQEGAPVGPRDGAMYDDPPRSRGRNGLIAAVTLVACAVVGTAAAYGYRTYVGAGASKIPPIITAESTPSKVPPSLDSQPNKSIQDRVRDQGQGERLVSREEQPLDVRGSAPRQVLPSPYAPSPSFGNAPAGGGNQLPGGGASRGGQPPTSTPGSSSSAGGLTEPKSIRTIPIRPDGADSSGRPVTGSTPARPATVPKNAQAGRSGPVSLDPQTPNGPVNGPSSRDRELNSAAANVPDQPRLASAPPNVAPAGGQNGAFLVQLSSQKSEGEAQASFRSLQAKYPDQLGGRSAIVRRADLGDKGVFFRAMVGPFGSSDEATRFCSNLKAAGGNCIIQRN
jgi:hypothetical protein